MCGVCGCTEIEVTQGHEPTAHGHPEHGHPHGGDPAHTHEHDHEPAHTHEHDHHPVHTHEHDHDREAGRGRLLRMEQEILAKNNRFAERNRGFFQARGVLAVNLTSSPGSGKTTLLERMIRDLAPGVPLAVIEGDQETENDARRIRATGCRAIQINTGAGCHLDAERVGIAALALELKPGSILLIENVGNLVCPALFDLGERSKIALLSVTEGEDKPLKYPHMFRAADVMVLSKTDLLPHIDLDADLCVANARRVNPKLRIFPLSVRRGEGLDALYAWLREELAQVEKEAR